MRPILPALAKRFRLGMKIAALGVLAVAWAACSSKPEPQQWRLWYIPNEPKPGLHLAQTCRTYVFATDPVPVEYAVAVIDGWTGAQRPTGNSAVMHTGETFSGSLNLGPEAIHDQSNGYDVHLNVVYRVDTYIAAKARADADCPLRSK